MKLVIVLLFTCSTISLCAGQSPNESPSKTLQEQSVRAQALYKRHAFREAAAVLEELSTNPGISALPEWPDQLYSLACDEALEGKPKQAVLTLRQAVDLGTSITVDRIREDPDLISLHNDPQFVQIVAQMERRVAFWKDNPAIATVYKPVLTEDEKIAGLSKFWSEARFNFPFFGRLPNLDWDRVYLRYLPQVRAARTTKDYYLVMMRFAAELRDGHTDVDPPDELDDELEAGPAINTQLIEGKVLITRVSDPALLAKGVRVGEEIVAVDGQPVREYANQKVAPFVNGFTEQDRANRIYNFELLFGTLSSPVHLLLRDAEGKTIPVVLPRHKFDLKEFRGIPVEFKMLPGGIAYLAANEFLDDAAVKMMQVKFDTITHAKGLILDLRKNGGGNDAYGFALLSMLADKPFPTESWRMLEYKPVFVALGTTPGWLRGNNPPVAPNKAHFAKPVVVLIGPQTYSAAEDIVSAFDAMHRGTLIGEATGGSTGQPLMFKLPGGGTARICTLDVSSPDGRRFEGIGIPPQVVVPPSIGDIRDGRDAAVKEAMKIIQEKR